MTGPPTRVRFGLLGPVEVHVAGTRLQITVGRQRAVLALLLTAQGRAVSEDGLVDGLWGDDPPVSARNSLQSHISRLRGALGPIGERLRRVGGAYRLELFDGELDVAQVEGLLGRAQVARRRSQGDAVGLLAEAERCWRGPALAEFADVPGLQAERVRLDELRRVVRDELLEVRLVPGRATSVIPDAERAAAEEPLRELNQLLLARALYADGRQADALQVLRRYRHCLAEETGLDPSEALREVEHEILTQEPGLRPGQTVTLASDVPKLSPDAADWPRARPASSFFGRQAELAELVALTRTNRLVTVVGVGGVGKTRLVLEALDALGNSLGAPTLLDLSALREPADVLSALAGALGVRAGPGLHLEEAVLEHLAMRRPLLVIDNCEHLLSAVASLVTGIVRAAHGATVVATSRQRLGVDGEQLLRLAPLPVPDSDEMLGGRPITTPSMLLFADRAARVRRRFRLTPDNSLLVGRICRRLDGLPLSLELAAGMTAALGLADLDDRLDRRLDLLRSPGGHDASPSARHATLRSVLDWSHELLADAERRLFACLAVFDGGFDLPAAEQVAGPHLDTLVAGGLVRLVDASLVVAEESEHRVRYRLLDTVRQYGLERLAESEELVAVQQRHTAWAVAFAELVERALPGPDEARWARVLDADFPNIRSAWHRALACGDLASAARITVALSWWQERPEVWRWARTLAAREELVDSPYEAAVLGSAAQAAWFAAEPEEAQTLAHAGLRASGTAAGGRWRCRNVLAACLLMRGEFEESARLWEELGADPELPPARRALMAAMAALPLRLAERIDSAETARRVEPAADSGWPTAQAFARYFAAEAQRITDPTRAIPDLEEAIRLARKAGSQYIEGLATGSLVAAAILAGEPAVALRRLPGLLRHWQQNGTWIQQWATIRSTAVVLADLGHDEPAAVLFGASAHAPGAGVAATAEAPLWHARVHRVRTRLGARTFAAAAARGAATSRTQAVEYTLDTLQALITDPDRTIPAASS